MKNIAQGCSLKKQANKCRRNDRPRKPPVSNQHNN